MRAASRRAGAASLDLTPAEFRLLKTLSHEPGKVFSREQLLNHLYDDYRVVTDRTIDSHIKTCAASWKPSTPTSHLFARCMVWGIAGKRMRAGLLNQFTLKPAIRRVFHFWNQFENQPYSPYRCVYSSSALINSLAQGVRMSGWFELSKAVMVSSGLFLKQVTLRPFSPVSCTPPKVPLKTALPSVHTNSPSDERYEKKPPTASFFNLSGNHQVIGTSQMYASEQSRDKGIASVKTNGPTQTVKDHT
jgi:uncharacterized protein YegP (UPF0339 family)